ncbi:hypothetical protein [Rhodopirellula sp. MGV]|uniref:hypothetical protein n=1 Tax=Rhodopirellula sp. MGV TaxID=2023130 RepID=UPI000B978EA4|nr:hypothetical protein [Rhodopirellula sp. MGV]OYP37500.1 hypothetical protein CGZ80_05065 [Rhodopirellula sp. MGV]PNY37902.1 hypothetical protein C2E31_05200 [Rhodopirellula baltica]
MHSPSDERPDDSQSGVASSDPHSDKYNDPRVKITKRGILLGLFVIAFGIVGGGLSIWARRTKSEQTTKFWGEQVVTAFQLAEEIELFPPPNDDGEPVASVRLSGMPGLGHLRHMFLDDRSYDWDSVVDEGFNHEPQSELIVLKWSDPTGNRFPEFKVAVDPLDGWVGVLPGKAKVRLNERFREAVPSYLKQIADFEPQRVENRKDPIVSPEG